MKPAEYAACDATELKRLLDAREVSAAEVRDAALRAIDEVEPTLNAVVHGPFEEPIPHDGDGPLGGVPFAIKDLLAAPAGYPQECGCRLLEGRVAHTTTTLMERFERAGLVTLVKTATPELGLNANTAPVTHGPTRNPWRTDRIPGGSSGGSAALVAARALPAAHANDGGGSIRIPAACCGLVGLKPSRGRVPSGPLVWEAGGGMAAELAVTRTVRDTAVLLDLVCGPAAGERTHVVRPPRPYREELHTDPGRLRVALQTGGWRGIAVHPEVTAAVAAVGRELERMGHHVELTVPDFDVEGFFDAMRPVWTSGLAVTAYGLGREMGREPSAENLEAVTWAGVQEGVDVTALQLAPSHAAQNALARKWGRFLDDFDLHVCPTLAQPPLALGALDQDSRDRTFEDWARELMAFAPFTQLYNNTGQPAISLPLGMTRDGLPVGVMFGAQALREDLLLQVAARLEEAMPWAQRAPSVQVGAATAALGS